METCDGKRVHQGMATRKRRACDRCVRQKKACNASSPCQNCEKRGASCQYSRVGHAAVPSTTTAVDSQDNNIASTMPWRTDGAADIASASTTTISALCHPTNQPVALQYGDNWSALVHETVSDFSLLDSHVADTIDQEWPIIMSPSYATDGRSQPVAASDAYQSDAPYQGYSFHFLADVTSRSGLVSSFDCGTLMQRREVVSSFLQSSHDSASTAAPLSSFSGDGGSLTEFRGPSDPLASTSPGFPTLTSDWQSWLVNPMVIKLQQIVLRIKEVTVTKPRNSTVTLSWSPALETRCLDFFSVSRFGKFLELYWSVWHPNVNFLHRPTFDPLNTPTTLLAAMAIIGK